MKVEVQQPQSEVPITISMTPAEWTKLRSALGDLPSTEPGLPYQERPDTVAYQLYVLLKKHF
jgi:hypothetical protein